MIPVWITVPSFTQVNGTPGIPMPRKCFLFATAKSLGSIPSLCTLHQVQIRNLMISPCCRIEILSSRECLEQESLKGAVKEDGKMITKHETVFGVEVKYFDGKVDFVQKIKMKNSAKTSVIGTVTFIVCNDEQCLLPATQKFRVPL